MNMHKFGQQDRIDKLIIQHVDTINFYITSSPESSSEPDISKAKKEEIISPEVIRVIRRAIGNERGKDLKKEEKVHLRVTDRGIDYATVWALNPEFTKVYLIQMKYDWSNKERSRLAILNSPMFSQKRIAKELAVPKGLTAYEYFEEQPNEFLGEDEKKEEK